MLVPLECCFLRRMDAVDRLTAGCSVMRKRAGIALAL